MRKKYGFSEDDFIFINVVNWNEEVKAQDLILKAFSMLKREKVKLIMVGEGTDIKGKAIAKSLNIENKFVGFGFKKNVEEFLQMADVFVLFSNLEGIAGALIQAMATGLIPISSKVGGVPDYLNEKNGFLVEKRDVLGLKNAMEKVLDLSYDQKNKIIEEAIKTSLKFSPENLSNKYIKMLESLV